MHVAAEGCLDWVICGEELKLPVSRGVYNAPMLLALRSRHLSACFSQLLVGSVADDRMNTTRGAWSPVAYLIH